MNLDSLSDFIAAVSGDAKFAIEENLGGGFVRLRVAEAERRQAKQDIRSVEDACIEMLRNSRDAGASNIYIALLREGERRELVFIDDGIGVPSRLQERIFEPRVTSKLETVVEDRWGVHGRGMALYSIRQNAESAELLQSGEGLGAAFKLVFDLRKTHELKDQSTFPSVEIQNGKYVVARGPHNLLRCIAEFALEERDDLHVFLGTPTTIAALLYATGKNDIDESEALFLTDFEELPVAKRPAFATSAAELMRECGLIGLNIGERTAHRIRAGQIEHAEDILSSLLDTKSPNQPAGADIYKDSRGLKVSKADISEFKSALEDAFFEISEKYYLTLSDRPAVRIGKDSITVKFPIEKEL